MKKYYKTIQINKRQIRLHRYIIECLHGRELSSSEIVHHIDGNIYNNNIKNLKVMSRAEHFHIHNDIPHNKIIFNKVEVLELFKKYPICVVSKKMGYSNEPVRRYIKSENLIDEIKKQPCGICGVKPIYKLRPPLCRKCYQGVLSE